MRFVKFITTKIEYSVDEEQAKEIMESDSQIVPLRNEKGEWTLESINKAFIIGTTIDQERTRWFNLEQKKKEAEQIVLNMSPEEKEKIEKDELENRKKISQMFAEIRNKFKMGK